MNSVLTSLLTVLIPLALVVALSPLSIIPGILMLHTARPRETSLAFLTGWLAGIGALTAICVVISGSIGGFNHPPRWASWLRIVIGVGLIAFGVARWAKRSEAEHAPSWMRSLTSATPGRALGTAMALTVVNVKVLFVSAAAGLAIGSAGLGTAGAWASVAYYTLIAGSSVALPTLAYAVAPARLEQPLERLKDWMERNHAALVAGILVVIGILVLYKGIHTL